MSNTNIGDVLYRLVSGARSLLFGQGELAQLTYGAFNVASANLSNFEGETIEISYPVGLRPDRTAIPSVRQYAKDDLLQRYKYLAFHQLPLNGLVQMVMITEALLGDIVRAVVTKYPQKLGAKRSVPLQVVLEAKTIDDVHIRATDALLHELSYKSPSEFAGAVESLLSLNLLECPAFHRYVEVKATRDIYIHNRGVANETYLRKVGSHARAQVNYLLPVDIQYFLESYESCLQLTEWLERELHERWHSTERERDLARATQSTESESPEGIAPLDPTKGLDTSDESTIQDVEEGSLHENQKAPAKRRRKARSRKAGGA